ncbi:immunoglobulin-like domain-containing receptor 1 [Stegostoma tigrinum]|uniref:immunoglobulin-like domain-containing receptor 1 n=1 Tax=Stegostoma tigrinum TaxID=3053191 RepID=UPI00202AE5A0|nr:immunoglobulin-like domain-containing receptor 1 [Stegostoma tigrinum]XP_048397294.1 immunoglobulin-like domain-containing receptor 1 [Stegostoma tigrinum]XP_048397295.1 immunoglobulin-like domain-containing receptor 1 [Stegostoma tigrinum]
MKKLCAYIVFSLTQTACHALLVTVQETQRVTMLFSSIALRCDYSTSSQSQDVVVTWRFKSFCKDPVMEYYSSSYIAMLSMGQDPTNDCHDDQRTVRIVIQKRGQNEPILGHEYRQRKITIQNRADLWISEVMWWDHGVYFCTVEAPGDTTGDSDKEVRLIVLHWLTVIFIIMGILLLFILISICWCQCCPQRCCCYLRCICCPKRCCCPEEALARHELVKQAKQGMLPWMFNRPMYGGDERNSQLNSTYINGLTQRDFSTKNSIPLTVVPYSGHPDSSVKMLDYIENEVKNLNTVQPLQNGIRTSGSAPPSVLSSLNEIGVREIDRRVIHLPPIMETVHDTSLPSSQRTSNSSRRNNQRRVRSHEDILDMGLARSHRSREGSRSSRSSQDRRTNRSQGNRRDDFEDGHQRGQWLPRRQNFEDYSDDSDYEDRSRHSSSNQRHGRRGYEENRRPHRRSNRDYSPERRNRRRDQSYSPPPRGRRQGSWSSLDDNDNRSRYNRVRSDDRMAEWLDALKKPFKYHEKPPSYHSVDGGSEESSARRSNRGRQSDRGSSHSGRSVVI